MMAEGSTQRASSYSAMSRVIVSISSGDSWTLNVRLMSAQPFSASNIASSISLQAVKALTTAL